MIHRPLYRVELSANAARKFRKLPISSQKRLKIYIDSLANTPRPRGVLKLKGSNNGYRQRVGDYRILYEIQDEVLLVLVVELSHRKESYR